MRRGRPAIAAALIAAWTIVVLVGVPRASSAPEAGAGASTGRQIYAEDCQSCHGPDGEGVKPTGPAIGVEGMKGEGPSLKGIGAAAVHLYLEAGYMPLDDPDEQPRRRQSPYTSAEISSLVSYVKRLAGPGGPPVPRVDADSGDLAEGQKLFTGHCAGCHQVVGEGGLVVPGLAPELDSATPTQVGEAVRVGPYVMPRFGEGALDGEQLNSLARYVDYTQHPRDAGGWSIGRIGPIPEGIVAWVIGAVVLVGVARLIGSPLR